MGNRHRKKAEKGTEKPKKGLHYHPLFGPLAKQLRHNMEKHQELVHLVQTLTLHNQALAELLVEHTEVTHEAFQEKCSEVKRRFFPNETTDDLTSDVDSDETGDRADSSLLDSSENHRGAEVEGSDETQG